MAFDSRLDVGMSYKIQFQNDFHFNWVEFSFSFNYARYCCVQQEIFWCLVNDWYFTDKCDWYWSVFNRAHDHISEIVSISIPSPRGGPEQLAIVAVLKTGPKISVDTLKASLSKTIQTSLNPLFKVNFNHLISLNLKILVNASYIQTEVELA